MNMHNRKTAVRDAVRAPALDLLQDNARQPDETQHQKVFRLVGERRFEEAARLAKRLIDTGDVDGFFIYTRTAGHARAQKLFDDKVSLSRKNMFTEIQGLTPQYAQVILENNIENRKINVSGLVDRMRDIVDGRWELTGQGLIIAKSGELNDGQHRAWAVLLTTTSVRIPIFYGALRSAVVLTDLVRPRSGADRFGFAGIKNASLTSSMVGLYSRLTGGRTLTEAEKLEKYYDKPDLYQNCATISYGMPRGASNQAIGVAAMLMYEAGVADEKIKKFFDEVKTGAGLAKRSATLAMRDAIQLKQFKVPVERQVYTVIELFNFWSANKKVSAVIIATEMPKVHA